MYDTGHPAYQKLQDIGKDITTKVKPKTVVVYTAYWQAEGDYKIQVNAKENADLIYEKAGFKQLYQIRI